MIDQMGLVLTLRLVHNSLACSSRRMEARPASPQPLSAILWFDSELFTPAGIDLKTGHIGGLSYVVLLASVTLVCPWSDRGEMDRKG